MTIAVFVIAGALAWWHYVTAGRVVYTFPGFTLTVWIAWMGATMLAAGFASAIGRDRLAIKAWGVLALVFVGNHLAWTMTVAPVHAIGALHLFAAIWFASVARERFEIIIACIYAASVFVAILTILGAIQMPSARPKIFLAFSHPDLVAIAGHCAHMVLGGVNDGGKTMAGHLSRPYLRRPSRGWAFVRRAADHFRHSSRLRAQG